ncbi:DUF6795 domain-containing protein [Marinomonas spartinae]|uniref:DUF6795 domain-containing protein n=1 Tax=Marinomonas spartinae TaxID=1792290 RepID=UPI0018F16FF4|nr:DUF6795 domain-containing protein [Marinomonas spartinae]MBJ7556035.1 hypothetical protein [Marinomonas spartinae]
MVSFFGLKRYDVELSPPVKGRITDNGEPVVGAEVVRELFYAGYDKKNALFDYSTTNDNGEFEFDEKIVKSRSPGDIFGQNSMVFQDIYIEKKTEKLSDEDKYYWLWCTRKSWPSEDQLNKLMLHLEADLQNKEIQHEVDLSKNGGRSDQPIISLCYFKDESIKSYYKSKVVENYNELK